jgi:hypothetical protein
MTAPFTIAGLLSIFEPLMRSSVATALPPQRRIRHHEEDIAEFTKQSKMKAGDPTVSFASDTLPVLQKHLQAAESLEKGSKR